MGGIAVMNIMVWSWCWKRQWWSSSSRFRHRKKLKWHAGKPEW